MIDKIISALESMQEDMEEHGEVQKARGVSSAIWLIAIMQEWADRKTEPQTCDTCKRKGFEGCEQPCYGCGYCDLYEPTDEPQITMDCSKCRLFTDGGEECDLCALGIIDEPQTDCAWR